MLRLSVFFEVCITVVVLMLNVMEYANAANYPMPSGDNSIVGNIQVISIVNPDLTLLDIARHYDLGYDEITRANPEIPTWVPKIGSHITIPTEFILPPAPLQGIIINIPQRRLFYFPKPDQQQITQVYTYPISIAREGWFTPLGQTSIIAKHRDPAWFVPKSILEEHRNNGEPDFPDYFPPGPNNPMGMLALQTGFPAIFIHGTNKPWGIGMRTSHGCLHLYPEDAAQLFEMVSVGTPVRIIDAPITIGKLDSALYMSASKPIKEYTNTQSILTRATSALINYSNHQMQARTTKIDWSRLQDTVKDGNILPTPISQGTLSLKEKIAGIKPQPYAYNPYGVNANNAVPPDAP
ncbi:putative L,D-transpeptidase YbiS precursor [mine drainage metagenome]|uniref:Putative L,D-transpeptidase YbiS n=1 Tax=mine drainage metagenome TaxID=410659 RepID=A0A1J5TNF3_9ZZZZ